MIYFRCCPYIPQFVDKTSIMNNKRNARGEGGAFSEGEGESITSGENICWANMWEGRTSEEMLGVGVERYTEGINIWG